MVGVLFRVRCQERGRRTTWRSRCLCWSCATRDSSSQWLPLLARCARRYLPQLPALFCGVYATQQVDVDGTGTHVFISKLFGRSIHWVQTSSFFPQWCDLTPRSTDSVAAHGVARYVFAPVLKISMSRTAPRRLPVFQNMNILP